MERLRQLCVHFELIFCSSISDIGDSILAHAYAKLPYHHKLLQKRSIRNALRTKLEKRHKTYAYFSVLETALSTELILNEGHCSLISCFVNRPILF